jgi:hypothetical protein
MQIFENLFIMNPVNQQTFIYILYEPIYLKMIILCSWLLY